MQPSGFDPSPVRTADAGDALDTGLRELSRRLDELMVSVEMLGSEGRWTRASRPSQPAPPLRRQEPPVPGTESYGYELPAPQPTGYEPPLPHPYPYEPPPPPAPVYGGWADPYEHAEPGWRTWAPEPGHLPAPIEPAAWEQPFDPPTPAWSPGIAAEAPAASLIEVASLDAGPFADLIELRHFEDDLSELARVRDVRVRRFGRHRASIDVAVSSAPLLEHELQLLGREMSIGATPEGEVVVELVPEPAADEEEAAGAKAPPAEGEGP